jgi:hypothetical protein|tara:strand:- start:323 stop:457 length:135 start_codon:yes stop_codon:yes gene_type:complete
MTTADNSASHETKFLKQLVLCRETWNLKEKTLYFLGEIEARHLL